MTQQGTNSNGRLSLEDEEMFDRFRIPRELVQEAGIVRVTDAEARECYGVTGSGDMDGLIFPYFLANGNGHRQRVTCRLRRDHPEIEDGKPRNKYIAPYGDGRHLYFPPNAEALLSNPETEIVFVEAEKSALALNAWAMRMSLPILPIATGGCWGWRGRIGKALAPDGERVNELGPLPDLACVEGRKSTILLDSNVAINQNVAAARGAFAATLRKLGAKEIRTPNLPISDGVNGPDDFLSRHSDEEMKAVLDSKPAGINDPSNFRDLFDSYDELVNAPPLSFAIRNFLQTDGITMVGGPSGHGKTLIALSMAKALLTGKPLWNHFPVDKRAVRVLYLIPECARGPFAHRLKLFGLLPFTAPDDERLLVRTLSKGRAPKLDDPRILFAAKGADVFLDTAIRFSESRDENDAAENQAFADALFALLASGARTVVGIHHSPKYFTKDTVMTLENVLRGSGDLGAILATCFGIKQIDRDQNVIHVENVKPRDFTPPLPFQLIGRPYIDETGDFAMLKKPGDCGSLEDEQPTANESNDKKRDERLRRVALVNAWLTEEPGLSNGDLMAKFKAVGEDVTSERSIRRYRQQADQGTSHDS